MTEEPIRIDELIELAQTYLYDGAFFTAAARFRKVADLIEERAKALNKEIGIPNMTPEQRKAAIEPFANDLKGMTLEQIKTEIGEVEDTVNRETDWLEALCARREELEQPGTTHETTP